MSGKPRDPDAELRDFAERFGDPNPKVCRREGCDNPLEQKVVYGRLQRQTRYYCSNNCRQRAWQAKNRKNKGKAKKKRIPMGGVGWLDWDELVSERRRLAHKTRKVIERNERLRGENVGGNPKATTHAPEGGPDPTPSGPHHAST